MKNRKHLNEELREFAPELLQLKKSEHLKVEPHYFTAMQDEVIEKLKNAENLRVLQPRRNRILYYKILGIVGSAAAVAFLVYSLISSIPESTQQDIVSQVESEEAQSYLVSNIDDLDLDLLIDDMAETELESFRSELLSPEEQIYFDQEIF